MMPRFVVRRMEHELYIVVDTAPRTALDDQGLPYACTAYVMAAGLTREEAHARADYLNANPEEAP